MESDDGSWDIIDDECIKLNEPDQKKPVFESPVDYTDTTLMKSNLSTTQHCKLKLIKETTESNLQPTTSSSPKCHTDDKSFIHTYQGDHSSQVKIDDQKCSNKQPAFIEFQNSMSCNTPTLSPKALPSSTGSNHTVSPGTIASIAEQVQNTSNNTSNSNTLPTINSTDTKSTNTNDKSFLQMYQNALLLVTLVASSFNLGALTAMLYMQYRKYNQVYARDKNRQKRRLVRQSYSPFDGNFVNVPSILLKDDDHTINDLREQVKRLFFGQRNRRFVVRSRL